MPVPDPSAKRRRLVDRLEKNRRLRDAARTLKKRYRYADRVMTIGREIQQLEERFPAVPPLRLLVIDP
jgi:hypothetical protein